MDTTISYPLYSNKRFLVRGQIRTITLHAGQQDEQIRCSLNVINVHDPRNHWNSVDSYDAFNTHKPQLSMQTSFKALSYQWGPPTPTRSILLDNKVIVIRDNLWHALRHLRYPTTDRSHIWIDAICIDQSNKAERAQQVSIMGDIYSLASEVLVWLGKTTETSLGMPIMDTEFYDPPAGGPYSVARRTTEEQDAAVQRLCENKYWTRVWIIQEIMHAQRITIYCGAHQMNWYDFLNAHRHRNWSDRKRTAVMLADHKKYGMTSEPLRTWLMFFPDSECQDVRDKIYGFRSLLRPASRQQIVVDYDKPIQQLYEEVSKIENLDLPGTVNGYDFGLLRSALKITVPKPKPINEWIPIDEIDNFVPPKSNIWEVLTRSDFPKRPGVNNWKRVAPWWMVWTSSPIGTVYLCPQDMVCRPLTSWSPDEYQVVRNTNPALPKPTGRFTFVKAKEHDKASDDEDDLDPLQDWATWTAKMGIT